jgi:hypothetical protein
MCAQDVIIEKHTIEAEINAQRAPASGKYKSLMSQLCDLLQVASHPALLCNEQQ